MYIYIFTINPSNGWSALMSWGLDGFWGNLWSPNLLNGKKIEHVPMETYPLPVNKGWWLLQITMIRGICKKDTTKFGTIVGRHTSTRTVYVSVRSVRKRIQETHGLVTLFPVSSIQPIQLDDVSMWPWPLRSRQHALKNRCSGCSTCIDDFGWVDCRGESDETHKREVK